MISERPSTYTSGGRLLLAGFLSSLLVPWMAASARADGDVNSPRVTGNGNEVRITYDQRTTTNVAPRTVRIYKGPRAAEVRSVVEAAVVGLGEKLRAALAEGEARMLDLLLDELSKRLDRQGEVLAEIRRSIEAIKQDTEEIKTDTAAIRVDTEEIKEHLRKDSAMSLSDWGFVSFGVGGLSGIGAAIAYWAENSAAERWNDESRCLTDGRTRQENCSADREAATSARTWKLLALGATGTFALLAGTLLAIDWSGETSTESRSGACGPSDGIGVQCTLGF